MMKQLNKKVLAASIVLALGTASTAWANPTNNAHDEIKGDNHQTATATSAQSGNTSPQANEFSTATQDNNSSADGGDAAANNGSTATSDRSDHSDHSDHSDNSYSDASDFGISANNNGTATNSSTASASDAAANNGSSAFSDRSANAEDTGVAANNGSTASQDNSYADVHGTGAAANGGGNATYTDSHDTDNSYASASGSYNAAANNQGTAEVHVAVSESTLNGTVTANVTTITNAPIGLGAASYNANNSADGAVAGASGVINFSQNTGQNALTQQSVSTQASLTVN